VPLPAAWLDPPSPRAGSRRLTAELRAQFSPTRRQRRRGRRRSCAGRAR
jgi:hypothetical protein